MSCVNANVILEKGVTVSVANITKRSNANATITKCIIVNCSLVCGVHNGLNLLTNSGKILFDDNKLLLI